MRVVEMKVIQPGDEVELVCLIPLSEQIANKTGLSSIRREAR